MAKIYNIQRGHTPTIRGLRNCGLSCCVNALLQSISATEEFVHLLDRLELSGSEERNSVPMVLKKTILAMQGESVQPAPHRKFLDCLHSNAISINVQHDADEVFLSILNLIHKQMTDTELKEEILELYKVKIEGNVTCLDCTYVHKVSSYLLSFPLPLQEGQNSLEKCIQTFFGEQELQGEDACYCERCGEKQPSKQGFKLCSLPKILCIHLKRFRSENGLTKKLHCKVTFPKTLNFTSNLQQDQLSESFKKGDSTYSLYAVVVHSGFAYCGHYTAFIKSPRGQEWYYADDSSVHQATWDDIQSTFGGQTSYRTFSGTAYMLLYRRQSSSEDQGRSG